MLDSSTGYTEKAGVSSCLCWLQELLGLLKGPWLWQRGQNKLSFGKGSDQAQQPQRDPSIAQRLLPLP